MSSSYKNEPGEVDWKKPDSLMWKGRGGTFTWKIVEQTGDMDEDKADFRLLRWDYHENKWNWMGNYFTLEKTKEMARVIDKGGPR